MTDTRNDAEHLRTQAGRDLFGVLVAMTGDRDHRSYFEQVKAIEAEAAAQPPSGDAPDLREFHPVIGAIEGMQGYVNGMTLDTSTGESWHGLESDSVPGSIQSSGDWLQRGPVIAAVRDALAASAPPSLDVVWAVVFSNYSPAEVTALYATEAAARAHAEALGGTAWNVQRWTVARTYAGKPT